MAHQTATHRLYKIESLRGRQVTGTDGKDLGKIEELVMDTQRGCIAYAVLSFGGFMGVGQFYDRFEQVSDEEAMAYLDRPSNDG